jgi:hypothetical protein
MKGAKTTIIEPTSRKKINVEFMMVDAVLNASSLLFFNIPVKIGINTVDTAPAISTEYKRLGI